MAPYVEANSLSDITQIASNPPQYPRNPTEKQRDPLTLYIARVPGSKDIILTTLKPQLKNVTAEDVASSLYYFHLNTEDDARLLAEEQGNTLLEDVAESNMAEEKLVHRKPLPEASGPSIDLNLGGAGVQSETQINTECFHRKPLPLAARPNLHLGQPEAFGHQSSSVSSRIQQMQTVSHEPNTEPRQQPKALTLIPSKDHAKEVVQRKPMGPRPYKSEYRVGQKPRPGNENRLPAPQNQGLTPSKVSSDSSRSDISLNNEIKSDGPTQSFLLTVIRRDPSSNAQWNIGSVTGLSHSRGAYTKKQYLDISILLTTPGYTSFRNSQAAAYSDGQLQSHIQQGVEEESAPYDGAFGRRVCMEGSNFFERQSKAHKQSRPEPPNVFSSARGHSTAVPGIGPQVDATNAQDSSSKGYVFLSPWGGRCKFTTGGGGRSLRCKHTLPKSLAPSNAVFESSGSADLSELRFNLPHYTVFKSHASRSVDDESVEPKRFSIPKLGHIRNKLSQASRPPLPPRPDPTSYAAIYPSDDEEPPPLPPRLSTDQQVSGSSDEQELPPLPIRPYPDYTPKSSDEDHNNERLDLSLGREKAGGGNRGKRAKLGKLIIHDEGFKMLDLVVAANMGIWWSVFDNH